MGENWSRILIRKVGVENVYKKYQPCGVVVICAAMSVDVFGFKLKSDLAALC